MKPGLRTLHQMTHHDALPMWMGRLRHFFLSKICGNSSILAFLQRPRQQLAAEYFEAFRCNYVTKVNSPPPSPMHEVPPPPLESYDGRCDK